MSASFSKIEAVAADAVSRSHGYPSYAAPHFPVHLVPASTELPVPPVRHYLVGPQDPKGTSVVPRNAAHTPLGPPPSYETAVGKKGLASYGQPTGNSGLVAQLPYKQKNSDWLDELSDNERRGIVVAAASVFGIASIVSISAAISEHKKHKEQVALQPHAGEEVYQGNNPFSKSGTVAGSDGQLSQSLPEPSSEKPSAFDVKNAASASDKPSLLQSLFK